MRPFYLPRCFWLHLSREPAEWLAGRFRAAALKRPDFGLGFAPLIAVL